MSDPGICQSQLSDKESAEYEWSRYGVISYYVFGVGCLFFYLLYQFSFHICFNEWEEHSCWFKTCQVSSCGSVSVCDLIITHTFPLPPPFLPYPSLLPDLLLPRAGTLAHFLLVGAVLEKGDVGVARRGDWPRGVRTAMLGFSAPVSKEHSVAVWREECLCVVRVGLPCQHFKLRRCTYWFVHMYL